METGRTQERAKPFLSESAESLREIKLLERLGPAGGTQDDSERLTDELPIGSEKRTKTDIVKDRD